MDFRIFTELAGKYIPFSPPIKVYVRPLIRTYLSDKINMTND